MGKVARGVALAAALALGAGCSSTSTNEGSGGASGAGASGGSAGGASGGASGGGASGASSGGASSGPVTCEKHQDCAELCGALDPVCPAVAGGMPYCQCYTPNGYCSPGETVKCPPGMTCGFGGDRCSQTAGKVAGATCSQDLQCPPGELCEGLKCKRPCKVGADTGCQCIEAGTQGWGWCQ